MFCNSKSRWNLNVSFWRESAASGFCCCWCCTCDSVYKHAGCVSGVSEYSTGREEEMIGAAAPRLASPIGFPHWMTSRYIIRSQDGGGGGGGNAVRGENLISLSFQLDTLVSVQICASVGRLSARLSSRSCWFCWHLFSPVCSEGSQISSSFFLYNNYTRVITILFTLY